MKNKQLAKQIVIWIIGLMIIQIGVALFLSLNLGSDPFTLFTQGVARKLGISPGTANRLLTFILLGILVFLDKGQIKIGTFLGMISAGMLLDKVINLLNGLQMNHYPLVVKIIIFIGGCIIICIGFPILKSSGIGVAPNDLFYLALVKRCNKPYRIIRASVDAIYMIIGISLGGVIGIGTVLCIILLGPIMDFFFPKIDRIINDFLQDQNKMNKQHHNESM